METTEIVKNMNVLGLFIKNKLSRFYRSQVHCHCVKNRLSIN